MPSLNAAKEENEAGPSNTDQEASEDIAYLTASVTQNNSGGILWGNLDQDGNMTGIILDAPAATSTPKPIQHAYEGKGKGVGKGSSGSSGPPIKRRQGRFQVPRSAPIAKAADGNTTQKEAVVAPRPRKQNEEDNRELVEPAVEQYIGVGIQRGHTIYPSYLFEVPPKKLKIDHLRRKFMITEIARSRTQRRFYRRAITMMSSLKAFFRGFAAKENFPSVNQVNGTGAGDHGYAMDISASSSEEDNTDFEGDV